MGVLWSNVGELWLSAIPLVFRNHTGCWRQSNLTSEGGYLLIFQLVWSPNHSHVGIKQPSEIELAGSRQTSSGLTTKPQCRYAFLCFRDLRDRLSWVSVAVKRLLGVGSSIFIVRNYFCSCPAVLNKREQPFLPKVGRQLISLWVTCPPGSW